MRVFDTLTKDEIIHIVHHSGCKMLRDLKLEGMTRKQLEDHLVKAKCPVILFLMKKK